jgi:hypothetical protein
LLANCALVINNSLTKRSCKRERLIQNKKRDGEIERRRGRRRRAGQMEK